jgi:hypothetical protein
MNWLALGVCTLGGVVFWFATDRFFLLILGLLLGIALGVGLGNTQKPE